MIGTNFFDIPEINKVQAIIVRNVSYLRNLSIVEFKALYGIETIKVIKNKIGFIVFSFLNSIGYIDNTLNFTIPKIPVISLVTDKKGNLFYLLHEHGVYKKNLTFAKSPNSNKKDVYRTNNHTDYDCSDWEEEQEYLRSSYEDAFEGDSDAYWNID